MKFPVICAVLVSVPLSLMAQAPARAAGAKTGATGKPAAIAPAKPAAIAPAKPAAIAPVKPAARPSATVSTPVLKMPTVSTFDLPNGMRVWLAPDSELPSVWGKLVFNAGTASEPEAKNGLAVMVADLLVAGGTAHKSPAEARRFLADRAAEVVARAGSDTTTVRFWTLADQAMDVVPFLADAVATPFFDRVTFFAAKDQLRRRAERRNDVAVEVAAREFTRGAFGAGVGSPLELAGISRIQREDLFDFHRRAFRPEGAQLVVSGDFDPAVMRALVEKSFGSWKPAPATPLARRTVAISTAATVRAASVPNAASTALDIGYSLENPTLDDYAVLSVLAQVLMKPFEAMAQPADAARNPPTVDSLGAQVRLFDGPSSFRVIGQARLRETTEAVRDALAAIDMVREGSVTAADFSAARLRAIHRFRSDFARPQATLALYGLTPPSWGAPADFLPKVGAKLATLSLEEFLQSVKRMLVASRRTVALAGEIRDFRSPLEMLKMPVTTVDMTIAPAPPEGVPTAEQAARGAEKWQRMRVALKVDRTPVRDAEIRLSGIVLSGRSDTLEQTARWIAPATVRMEQKEKADRESVAFYDGAKSWYYDGFRTAPFSATGVRIYRGETFRFVHWLAARNLTPPLTVHDIGSGVIRVTDGVELVEIALNDETGLPETFWYTDPSNGIKAEERVFDYKDYGGFPYWGRLEMYRGGGLAGELNTVSARFNVGLNAAQLERSPDQK